MCIFLLDILYIYIDVCDYVGSIELCKEQK